MNAPGMSELPKTKNDDKLKNDQFGEPAPQHEVSTWAGISQSRKMGGIVLIVIGLIFLSEQLFGFHLTGNWWSIFIFVPAAGLLYGAYTSYKALGAWTQQARGQMAGGTMLMLVALLALSGRWDLWPLFLITAGALALFGFNR